MANHFSIVALRTHEPMKREKYMILDDENPMNIVKRQNDMAPEVEPPRSDDVQYATGEEQRNSSRKNELSELKQK